jgi:uncharacterized protein (DUF983 family)
MAATGGQWLRAARLFWRAILLRCPRCGRAPALAGWFTVRSYCPVCHFRFDRGDRGYFLGAGCLNLVVAEIVFGFGLLAVVVFTWPNPPWNAMQYVGIPLMVLMPILFFPFSRTIWIALDLAFRSAERHDEWTGEEDT